MKATNLAVRVSGPLLVFGGQATAQDGSGLQVAQVQKITDPLQGGYRPFMEFTVGDQTMRGLLDTGSSDLTVPQAGSDFCKGDGQQCDGKATGFLAGSFDPEKNAADVKDLNVPLNASFTGGAQLLGKFIEAPLRVSPQGGAVPVEMGLVNGGGEPPGEVSFPIVGTGPIQGESTRQNYPNIPARLKEAGVIKTNAYGLYLGDFRE